MAINLPSDIVLEVARAADPEAVRSVTARLTSLGEANGVASEDFSRLMDGMRTPALDLPSAAPQLAAPEIRDESESSVPNSPAKTYEGFEALILQNLIELMLPQNTTAIFGDGTAGDMWKSMLSQQLGSQVAKADRSGLFSRVFAGDDLGGERRSAENHSNTAFSSVGSSADVTHVTGGQG